MSSRWHTRLKRLSTFITSGLLVYKRLEVLEVVLQVMKQTVESGEAVVNEGDKVAVQALEGGEAVVISHGGVEGKVCALCARRESERRLCVGECRCCSRQLKVSNALAGSSDAPALRLIPAPWHQHAEVNASPQSRWEAPVQRLLTLLRWPIALKDLGHATLNLCCEIKLDVLPCARAAPLFDAADH